MTKSVGMTGEPKVALWSCACLLGPTPTIVSHCQTFSTFFHQWVQWTNLLHCLSSFPFLFRGWDAYRFQDCRVSSRIYSIIMYPIFPISCFWWCVSRITVSVTRHLATLQVCWPLVFCRSPPQATDNEDGKFGWRHCVQTTGEGYYSATWRCCDVFFVDGWANIFIEKYRVFMPSMIPVPGEMCWFPDIHVYSFTPLSSEKYIHACIKKNRYINK